MSTLRRLPRVGALLALLVMPMTLAVGCAKNTPATANPDMPRTVMAEPATYDGVVIEESYRYAEAPAENQQAIGYEQLSNGDQVTVVQYVHTYPEAIETFPRVYWSGRWYYNVQGDFVWYSDYYGSWCYYWGPPAPLVVGWNAYYPWSPYSYAVGYYGPGWYWGGVGVYGYHAYGLPVADVHHHHHHYYADNGGGGVNPPNPSAGGPSGRGPSAGGPSEGPPTRTPGSGIDPEPPRRTTPVANGAEGPKLAANNDAPSRTNPSADAPSRTNPGASSPTNLTSNGTAPSRTNPSAGDKPSRTNPSSGPALASNTTASRTNPSSTAPVRTSKVRNSNSFTTANGGTVTRVPSPKQPQTLGRVSSSRADTRTTVPSWTASPSRSNTAPSWGPTHVPSGRTSPSKSSSPSYSSGPSRSSSPSWSSSPSRSSSRPSYSSPSRSSSPSYSSPSRSSSRPSYSSPSRSSSRPSYSSPSRSSGHSSPSRSYSPSRSSGGGHHSSPSRSYSPSRSSGGGGHHGGGHHGGGRHR